MTNSGHTRSHTDTVGIGTRTAIAHQISLDYFVLPREVDMVFDTLFFLYMDRFGDLTAFSWNVTSVYRMSQY